MIWLISLIFYKKKKNPNHFLNFRRDPGKVVLTIDFFSGMYSSLLDVNWVDLNFVQRWLAEYTWLAFFILVKKEFRLI